MANLRELSILVQLERLFKKSELCIYFDLTVKEGATYKEFLQDLRLEVQSWQIVGYKNSMEFLTKHDPSLGLAVAAYNAQGGVKELMNSERLANCLLVQLQLDEIERLKHEIKDIFAEYEK